MASKTLAQRTKAAKTHAKLTINYGGIAVLVVATATHLIPGVDGAIQHGVAPTADIVGSGIATGLQVIAALVADVFTTATSGFGK